MNTPALQRGIFRSIFRSRAHPIPSGVTPRVLRLSRRASRRASVAAACLVTVGWAVLNSRAALGKLQLSTTRTNIASTRNRSRAGA